MIVDGCTGVFIETIRVRNYRSFLDSGEIPLSQLSAFVGRNGCGKSTLLRAIKLFYDPSSKVVLEDFHNRRTEVAISFEMKFRNLNASETEYFGSFLDNGQLAVDKEFAFEEGGALGQYFGRVRQHAGFVEIRGLTGREMTERYRAFRDEHRERYADLPVARSQDAVRQALAAWETAHPDQLQSVRAPVRFFGARNVGGGSLDNFTRCVLVPAVREASADGVEGRGSSLTELLNILVKEVVTRRPEIRDFQQRTRDEYRRLTSPETLTELPNLGQRLTGRLQVFVANTRVDLEWSRLTEPTITLPEAKALLTEDDFRGEIEGKGHGLQRAFIMTVLQELATVQAQREEQTRREAAQNPEGTAPREEGLADGPVIAADFQPDLILLIEEPELYQHPIRERHLAEILNGLVGRGAPNERSRVQIIHTTHSPYFVSIEHFDDVRVITKGPPTAQGELPQPTVRVGSLATVFEEVSAVYAGRWRDVGAFRDSLRNILHPLVNEGLFANAAVLVEGPDDRAIVEGALRNEGHSLARLETPIIEAGGKTSLIKIWAIFRHLGIRCFVVFDCDGHDAEQRARHARENAALLSLGNVVDVLGAPFPTTSLVTEVLACFPQTLERTLQEELAGFDFLRTRDQLAAAEGVSTKSPVIYERLLHQANENDLRSATVHQIVQRVLALAQH